MKTRILVAIPIVALVLLAIFVQGWVLAAFAVLLGLFSQFEVLRAFRDTEYRPLTVLSMGYAAVLAVLFVLDVASEATQSMRWLDATTILSILLAAVMLAFACAMFSRNHSFAGVLSTVFSLLYPQLFIVCFYWIVHGTGTGLWYLGNLTYPATLLALLMLFVPPVFSDTLAYFWGRKFGRTKLCPSISPNKTVAGSVAGLAGGAAGAVLVWWGISALGSSGTAGYSYEVAFGPFLYLVMGAILAAVSQIGDLVASYVKRFVDIKDFGHLLPGHGGVMDRIDSILFIMPLVLLFGALGWIELVV